MFIFGSVGRVWSKVAKHRCDAVLRVESLVKRGVCPEGRGVERKEVFGGGVGCGSIFHSFGVEILPKWQFLRNGSKPFSRGFSSPRLLVFLARAKTLSVQNDTYSNKKGKHLSDPRNCCQFFFISTHEFRIKCSLSVVTYYYSKIIFAAVYIYGRFFRMSLEISAVREIHF